MNNNVEAFALDEIPLPSSYGAAELKKFIRKYTLRGLLTTLGIFIFLILAFYIFNKVQENANKKITAPINKIKLTNVEDAPADEQQIQQIIELPTNSGPAARAGTPVPVPESQITPDMQEFASMKDISRASAVGGDGTDNGGFPANIDWNASSQPVNIEKPVEEELDPNEYIAVEVEPQVDLPKLQGLVNYPEMARRAGIEGKVVLRVLVDKQGNAKKVLVESSDNKLLDKEAIEAIKKYGKFEPAIQNRQPVTCWVSIPIVFKLR